MKDLLRSLFFGLAFLVSVSVAAFAVNEDTTKEKQIVIKSKSDEIHIPS